MKRILVGTMFTLPLIATALSKPASALEVFVNPQVHRYPDRAFYSQRYERREWIPGHVEYRYHRRFWVPGHFVYR